MTDEQIEIARALVARPEWRGVDVPRVGLGEGPVHEWLPNLTSDATGGVLLGMLPPGASADRFSDRWRVVCPGGIIMRGPTLAEAAGRALLACWEVSDG